MIVSRALRRLDWPVVIAVTALLLFSWPYMKSASYRSGPEGQGWPFGRDVHVSEMYELLDKVDGVDYVRAIQLDSNDNPQPRSITLMAHELVDIKIAAEDFTIMERFGGTWQQTR